MKNLWARITWGVKRLTSLEYVPPYGSIGHSVQSGKITSQEAKEYLQRTHDEAQKKGRTSFT